jgi:putative ABC transport system permease protein
VAALVGVRGFSESFRSTLTREARSLMAGDLAARANTQPSAEERKKVDALKSQGIRSTWVTETISMASVPPDPVPILVSLKAVDPAEYPYYGKAELDPDMPLASALTDNSVVVADEFLIRLKARVGDTLRLGGHSFRIAARLVQEPDRITAGAGIGPRVLISRSALNTTGLLAPGSRANERLLIELPVTMQTAAQLAAVRKQLEAMLPEAQVMDFREGNPALTEGLDRATAILSLICLVAMVLGAIGVAMAMRAHLQQRIEILAIMKSIGAQSSDILRIYLIQTLFLGVVGALLGVVLGLGVEYAFPTVLGRLLPLRPEIRLPLSPVLAALGTGVLTTLLFCLPPLLDVRNVRPSLVLRRMVDSGNGEGWVTWLKEHKVQLASIVVILAGLGGIAAALADSMLVGKWFAICLAGLLVFILGLSAVTLRTLRAILSRTRLHLPSALRHGLANLYRPGNQSSAVLAALGTGVMLILSVFLMQRSIVNALHEDVKVDTPNLFLIDMSTQEMPGIRAELKKQAGVIGDLEAVPIVSARMESIDGTKVEDLKLKNYPNRLLRNTTLSWADVTPDGTKIAEGKWWTGTGGADLAVVDRVAKRLDLKVGSKVTFIAGEKEIPVTVTAIYKIVGEHAFARSEFILPKVQLEDQPAVWYGDIHARPSAIPEIERALFATYPTVTVINIADILQTITGVVDQITIVIRFLAGFSILSGLIILASSIASTRFRRIREVVVLKTLGATRNRIATVFSVEFLVLGLLAGAVGALFANLLSRILLHRMDVVFQRDFSGTLLAVVGTAVLAVVTGWVASFHILGQKPLEILREE